VGGEAGTGGDGPAYAGYFADPFVLRLPDGGYVAYGTNEVVDGDRAFEALTSPDLVTWRSHGPVLPKLPPDAGDQYWAPEAFFADGAYWLYYSVGHGIAGHHIRVARSDSPLGPFADLGHNLTPDERFAIDPHPFVDDDGSRYLFFARDVLDGERVGTHLAAAPMLSPTRLGDTVPVLAPSAHWQLYQREREMYGAVYDWHTLEGPSVVRRSGRYWLTYSGGAWTGPGYGISWAVADSPLGPWTDGAGVILSTAEGLIGPGHNSLTVAPSGDDAIVFHAWNEAGTARRMHVRQIHFEPDGPRIGGPLGD
jgi:GH43 family beta-xylosidase